MNPSSTSGVELRRALRCASCGQSYSLWELAHLEPAGVVKHGMDLIPLRRCRCGMPMEIKS